jgi:hypothetical protein
MKLTGQMVITRKNTTKTGRTFITAQHGDNDNPDRFTASFTCKNGLFNDVPRYKRLTFEATCNPQYWGESLMLVIEAFKVLKVEEVE